VPWESLPAPASHCVVAFCLGWSFYNTFNTFGGEMVSPLDEDRINTQLKLFNATDEEKAVGVF
jgi:hypothetical protein